ncbi:MAG: hypothetical protein IKL53_08145 [Lachnospiraceae bacterium]|nr:hypothetical protein [Lachnospiraceae bacterium]
MIKIDFRNVQAIGEGHIEIEENTIVEFVGDNSNGKSVLSKVIDALTKGELSDRESRTSLIKDGTRQAIIIFTHNTEQLGILLEEEARSSFLMYTPNMNEPDKKVIRGVSDTEGCNAIIRKFGFRVYAKGDICLQLAPTFGAIPFITTSGSVNDEIVQDITSDSVADEFLKSFSGITFPIFKDRIKKLKQEKETVQTVLNNLESYDWRAYKVLAEKMKEVYNAIKDYNPITLEPVKVPNLDLYDVYMDEIPSVCIPTYYDLIEYLPMPGDSLHQYCEIMNGVCPTCGKPLV